MSRNLFWLNDEQWARIEVHLPTDVRGVERVDDRRVISGIVHVLKSGCRWCDCPQAYGPPTTIYNRFVRWARRGVWENLFRELAGNGRAADTQMIDSTHVKAHRSASGGKGGSRSRLYRHALRQAGAKLPRLCLLGRRSCMVDLMSPDPSQLTRENEDRKWRRDRALEAYSEVIKAVEGVRNAADIAYFIEECGTEEHRKQIRVVGDKLAELLRVGQSAMLVAPTAVNVPMKMLREHMGEVAQKSNDCPKIENSERKAIMLKFSQPLSLFLSEARNDVGVHSSLYSVDTTKTQQCSSGRFEVSRKTTCAA
jgi:transposase